MPSYTMSTFEVLKIFFDSIDALTGRYWWNPSKSCGKYLAVKSWSSLCRLKRECGLGFRRSKDFNSAILSKLAWMVASGRESLCMSISKSKYKVRKDWLRREPRKSASPIWRAIENAKSLEAPGACYTVRGGRDINIWLDP